MFLLHDSLLILILQSCTNDDPIIQLYQYEDYLQSGISWVNQFLAKIYDVEIDETDFFCVTELSSLIERIGLVEESLELLLGTLRCV